MTLNELTTLLGKTDPELVLPNGFTNPHSYRGYYDELAFEPAENVTVGSMLSAAWSADGATYTGYKGGEYTMTSDTTCWIAYEGSVGARRSPGAPGRTPRGGQQGRPATETSAEPLTPEREQEIRKRRTHCEATRWESESDRPVHTWGPSDYPTRDMCQRCTTMRTWAKETDTDEAVLLAEVDRLRARVAVLESATGTARAMHRRHRDSEHCQYDDMTWPCPTVTALGDPPEAAELVEGLAGLETIWAQHPPRAASPTFRTAPARWPKTARMRCRSSPARDGTARWPAAPSAATFPRCSPTDGSAPIEWERAGLTSAPVLARRPTTAR
ncbi:hypothetical protein NKH18_01400 [Streptomyces sp. M10(2022)]